MTGVRSKWWWALAIALLVFWVCPGSSDSSPGVVNPGSNQNPSAHEREGDDATTETHVEHSTHVQQRVEQQERKQKQQARLEEQDKRSVKQQQEKEKKNALKLQQQQEQTDKESERQRQKERQQQQKQQLQQEQNDKESARQEQKQKQRLRDQEKERERQKQRQQQQQQQQQEQNDKSTERQKQQEKSAKQRESDKAEKQKQQKLQEDSHKQRDRERKDEQTEKQKNTKASRQKDSEDATASQRATESSARDAESDNSQSAAAKAKADEALQKERKEKAERKAKELEEERRDNATKVILNKAKQVREQIVERVGTMGRSIDAWNSVIELYESAASQGTRSSGVAFNLLGELHLLGLADVTPNYTKAFELFDTAAEFGNADAQHNRALMYAMGIGTNQSDAKAVLNLYFAAVGQSVHARMALGFRHLYGYGVPKSCEASIRYYKEVAERVVTDISNEDSPGHVIQRVRLADERARVQSPDEDEDVIQYYEHSAENGDVGAQVALGQLHFYGARGVGQDAARAASYFRAAAAQGDAAAMANLGQMHAQGLGVEQDNATALQYFTDAAKKGSASAQNGLGFMYMHGRGVKKDTKKALKYFKQATDQGSADAQFNLGVMYFAGIGVDKNYGTALQYFNLAGHQGHTRALFNLGQMHMNGFGTVASCKTAVQFLKTVAERGEWGMVLSNAHREFLRGNLETALMMYARAAEEGFEVAQSNSAWLLDTGDMFYQNNSKELALRHFKHAAEQGNVDAQRMIGDYYFYGLMGAPDLAAAAQHYVLASDKADAQAMFNLGYMHQHGLGLPKDFHLAKRYYDQAASTDPNALVPTQLALLGLMLHHKWWDAWLGELVWWLLPDVVKNFLPVPASIASAAGQSSGGSSGSAVTDKSGTATPSASSGSGGATPSPAVSDSAAENQAKRNVMPSWWTEYQERITVALQPVTNVLNKVVAKIESVALRLGVDFASWEDLLLVVLLGLLAWVVYLQSRLG